jgi:FkbM family methyltransferase
LRDRNSFRLLTGAYSVARSAGLLEAGWFKRAFVASYFIYKRFWEDSLWGLVQREPQLFAGGDVFDIGANVGYTSCLLARALDSRCKVYSFEPDQSNFRMLTEVVARKNLSGKIVAMNAAVGSADGCVEFWHNEKHMGDHRVATSRFKNTFSNPKRITTVPSVTVDRFVESYGVRKISFVKIDVQGYESAVCEGMRRTIMKFPDLCICCEYSPEALRELGFEPAGLLDFFRTNGYWLHILRRSSLQLVRDTATIDGIAAKEAGYVDLVCSRKVIA